uniref:hypothetical protein n=1 Tax=Photorhabdus sp. RM322S TaxID=3342825 RepID=UPI0036DB9AA9
MYFPQQINEYILDYLREKCVRFDHPDTPSFLRSTDFILVDNIDVIWSEEKFQKNRKDARLVTLLAMIVLCTLLMIPLFLLLLQKDRNRCKAARRFYDKFAPWLTQKRAKAELRKVAERPALPAPETMPPKPKNKLYKGLSVFNCWLGNDRRFNPSLL